MMSPRPVGAMSSTSLRQISRMSGSMAAMSVGRNKRTMLPPLERVAAADPLLTSTPPSLAGS